MFCPAGSLTDANMAFIARPQLRLFGNLKNGGPGGGYTARGDKPNPRHLTPKRRAKTPIIRRESDGAAETRRIRAEPRDSKAKGRRKGKGVKGGAVKSEEVADD